MSKHSIFVAFALSLATLATRAELVLVAGAHSPAGTFSRQQVADIYLLKLKEFPGGGDIVPVMQSGGALREEFLAKVLGKSDAQIKGYWARLIFTGKGIAPKEAGNSTELKRLVAEDPHRVGFIDRSEVDASVKIIYPAS